MSQPREEIQQDYLKRINKVFQFIDKNPNPDLSLHTLAQIAAFSPYHFHRIFRHITGETLNEYVTRKRIEKAASMLLHQRHISITEIATETGFNSNSAFTRSFKKFYQISPTEFKNQNKNKFSKIRQLKSKNGQAYPDHEKYISIIKQIKNWIMMNAKIEVKEIDQMKLAYISCMGPQNLGPSIERLIRWAGPYQLMEDPETKVLTIYHDSFKITEPEKVRMSAGISLNKPVEVGGEIGITHIEAGKYIVGSFEIGVHEFEQSWTGLFIWMNENGYRKADRDPFEIYHNNFNEHPEKICIVDFYIPVE